MTLREDARRSHPDFPWLEAGAIADTQALLRALGWIASDEVVESAERAGAGNMNLVLRVRTNARTVILKQARPWVERYDHIAAPWDRILVERAFYERVATLPEVATLMPHPLAADATSRTLLLEDLGVAADLTTVYTGDRVADDELRLLGRWLRALHCGTRGDTAPVLANRPMRTLNHAHIFDVPLRPVPVLDLERHEPGLTVAAAALVADGEVLRTVRALGERYLADGPCLVHGDFFPGSWLRTGRGVRVIDPEFCHLGDPEVDLGCAVAHLVMSRHAPTSIACVLDAYGRDGVDEARLARWAAIEIVRRLLGVAQLPIPPSTGDRAILVGRAGRALREGAVDALLP